MRRYRAQLAERKARGLPIDPAVFQIIPCCAFSTHGDGTAHGADCLRGPDAVAELQAACCVEAFVFRGASHNPTCPTRTTRSNAA
jgi:hypothetical protein